MHDPSAAAPQAQDRQNAADVSASDIVREGWLRHLSPRAQALAELARLDRPIGTWLLLFPCWWGLALAGSLDLWFYALFGIGAVAMRGAGCTINDLTDRKIDGLVARTAGRPLPSGRVTVGEALIFLAAQLLIGLAVLTQFERDAILLGFAIMGVVVVYPLMKRVTWWPQIVLGIAFNWGAVVGYSVGHGVWPRGWGGVGDQLGGWAPVALYLGGIVWTLGYDTIYAHQDKDDDARIGVRSTARRLGDRSVVWVPAFYAAALAIIAAAGALAGLAWPFWIGIAVAAFASWRILAAVDYDDPKSCLVAFKANVQIGWAVLAGAVAAEILARVHGG